MRTAAWVIAGWLVGSAAGCMPEARLESDNMVRSAATDVRPSMRARQWHLRALPGVGSLSQPGKWVVAVLDTGVAYETAIRKGRRYERAPSWPPPTS